MDEAQIRALVRQLDTKDGAAEDSAWTQLRPLGAAVIPYFLEFYPHAKLLEGRRTMVFHATRHARTSEAAFQLGLAALKDRSSIVRYRACGVLAYSLRRESLPHLQALATHKDQKTVEDARAAIDAINRQNHHYFVDRNHTGRTFWEVNDGDIPKA
jgi:hypothetical protein